MIQARAGRNPFGTCRWLALLTVLATAALPACTVAGVTGADPGTPTPTVTATVDPRATATPTMTATPQPTQTSTPSPAPTITPTPAVARPEGWEAFADRLREAIEGYGVDGRYAVAVTDLQTGLTVSVNGDRPQLSACVMNFFVLVSALRGVRDGLYDAEMVAELVAATIWSSNAATAFTLYGITGDGSVYDGVQKVQRLIDELGLGSTSIDHPPAFGGAEDLSYAADDVDGADGAEPAARAMTSDLDNWVSALDGNKALVALWEGRAIEEPWRTELLEQMTEVKDGLNYLVAWVPYGTVSHKNGFFPNTDGTYVDNDFGIVRVESGGQAWAYAITFLSDSVPYKYGDITLGQELSSIAFDYFEATYGP